MIIKTMLSQNRRDFRADFECEHCGHIEFNQGGYDDDYFHNTVIPEMICKKCNRKSDENYTSRPTKYPEGYQI